MSGQDERRDTWPNEDDEPVVEEAEMEDAADPEVSVGGSPRDPIADEGAEYTDPGGDLPA